jgi:hypothetical protein
MSTQAPGYACWMRISVSGLGSVRSRRVSLDRDPDTTKISKHTENIPTVHIHVKKLYQYYFQCSRCARPSIFMIPFVCVVGAQDTRASLTSGRSSRVNRAVSRA